MTLEERSVIDKIEILLNGSIQVRRRDQILKNNTEVVATYHRHVLLPGDDLTDQDPRVSMIAELIWTPEVIQSFQESQKESDPTITSS